MQLVSGICCGIIKKSQIPSKNLTDYFYRTFKKHRSKISNDSIIYPDIYYETIYKTIEALAVHNGNRNNALLKNASGSNWLLGEEKDKIISEETYKWLWKNVLLAVNFKEDVFIYYHWETCHQYYAYYIPEIRPEYNYSSNRLQFSNITIVRKRNEERHKFIFFHYALVALLLFKKRYECISKLLEYSLNYPEKYELLPDTMNNIFKEFFLIRDHNDLNCNLLTTKFPFPEFYGVNANEKIKKHLMSYFALLFLRQYKMQPEEYPTIPNGQSDINEWICGIDDFMSLIIGHLNNNEVLSILDSNYSSKFDKSVFQAYFNNLKNTLQKKYNENAIKLEISSAKTESFYELTKNILESTFEDLKKITNTTKYENVSYDSVFLNGDNAIFPKDAFSENPEIFYMDIESILARKISISFYNYMVTTFRKKADVCYNLKPNDLSKSIDKLNINSDYIIVNFNIDANSLKDDTNLPLFSNIACTTIDITSLSDCSVDCGVYFILDKSDLPFLVFNDVDIEIINKYSLIEVSRRFNIYSSAVDMNGVSDEILNEFVIGGCSIEELRKSALFSIVLKAELGWKSQTKVVQINQVDDFFSGEINSIDDVLPINHFIV
jgi:hypothetical protein